MAQPARGMKRTVKLLVNLITFLCSVIVLVLVAATQNVSYTTTANDIPTSIGCALNVSAYGVCAYAYILGGIGCALALFVIFLALTACVTNEDAPVILDGTLHAFAALWWIIGTIILSVFVARANARHNPESPIAVSTVSTGVGLGGAQLPPPPPSLPSPSSSSSLQNTAQPKVQKRLVGDSGHGARIALVIAAFANAVIYSLSLWTNVCCCIASCISLGRCPLVRSLSPFIGSHNTTVTYANLIRLSILYATNQPSRMGVAVLGRAIAAIWVGGTAIGVYMLGAGIGSIGVSAIGLLNAESGWLVVSGAKRIAQAAQHGKTEELLNAGALNKLVIVAVENDDANARIAAATALEQMFADERARTNALANPGLINALSQCVDCVGARKLLQLPTQ